MIKIDASGQVLGRLASKVTPILTGKDKPNYRPNIIGGEEVTVFNLEKIIVTGHKLENKVFSRHSGYPGGLKQVTLKERQTNNPELVFRTAVAGMLPKNKLRKIWLKRLHLLKGEDNASKSKRVFPRPRPTQN